MINDYASLQAAVANWLARANLAAAIPDLIQMGELRIFRELRVRRMQAIATGTATGGVIPLPADYLAVQSLSVNWGGRDFVLTPGAPEDLANAAEGAPRKYVIIDDEIRLVGTDVATSYTLVYFARPEFLEQAVSGQNWIILTAPDLYLYATLLEAAPFLKNDARIPVWTGALANAFAAVQHADDSARFGPGLHQKPVVPNAP